MMDQEEENAAGSRNEWELSKENIQPLREGRILSNLTTGLHHSESDAAKLREQKQAFEYQLRMYNGDDPLCVWYSYVRWIQQNFPSGGPETGLQTLLENCVAKFNDVEKYKNDERFVDIWLKLVIFQAEPLEIFNFMMNKGIGVNLAAFYCAWADELESVGNFKKAESIYQAGMSKMAYPVQNIRSRYAEFQPRAMKAAGMQDATATVEPQRQTLGSIKGHGKYKVAGGERQTIKPALKPASKTPLAPSNTQQFTIFSDGASAGTNLQKPKSDWAALPKQGKMHAENIPNAGQWTKAKTAKTAAAAASSVPIAEVSKMQNPSFQVYVDQNVPDTPSGKSVNIGVLSERKAEKPASAHDIMNRVADSPGKKAMYQKGKVYGGVVELSFEEIHSRNYFRRQREKKEMEALVRKQLEQQNEFSRRQMKELQDQVQKLTLQLQQQQQQPLPIQQQQQLEQQQQILLQQQQEQQQQLLQHQQQQKEQLLLRQQEQQQVCAEPPAKRSLHVRSLGFEASNQETPPQQIPIVVNPPSTKTPALQIHQPSPLPEPALTSTPHYPPAIPASLPSNKPLRSIEPPPRKSLVKTPSLSIVAEDSRLEIPDSQMETDAPGVDDSTPNKSVGQNSSSDRTPGSLTMNTKEAMHVIQGMFNHTLKADDLGFDDDDSEILEDSRFAMKTGVQANSSKGAFQIFSDPPQQKIDSSAGAFQIYTEPSPAAAAPFTIHSDENIPAPGMAGPGMGGPGIGAGTNGSGMPTTGIGGPMNTQPPPQQSDLEGLLPIDEDMTFAPRFGSTQKFAGITQFMDEDMTFNPGFASTKIFTNMATPTCATPQAPPTTAQDAQRPPETTQRFTTTVACSNLSTIVEGSSEKSGSSGGHHDTTNHFCGHTIPASHLENTNQNKTGHHTMATSGFSHLDTNKTGHANATSGFPQVMEDDLDKLIGLEPTPKKTEFKLPTEPIQEVERSVRELSMQASINESRASTSSLGTNRQHVIDTSQYTPSLHSSVTEDVLSQTIAIDPGLNPFADDVIQDLLEGMETPITEFPGYVQVPDPVPMFPDKGIDAVTLHDEIYHVESKIGTGAFASVYLASKLNNEGFDDISGTDDKRALKVQKPACPWEFYIISTLHSRLSQNPVDVDVRPSIMSVDKALFYTDGSCLINQFHPHGSLLNLVNQYKMSSDRLPEPFVAYIVVELLYVAEALIKCGMIHGDIKPDNVLFLGPATLSSGPNMAASMGGKTRSIKLCDFGRGIDLHQFPLGTNFTAKVDTSGFQCIEMQTDKPWTHQTDLFGIVGTVHVLIFSNYMNVYLNKATGRWRTTGKIPRRWDCEMWQTFFDVMLNVESCEKIPDMREVRKPFENYLTKFRNVSLLKNWPLK